MPDIHNIDIACPSANVRSRQNAEEFNRQLYVHMRHLTATPRTGRIAMERLYESVFSGALLALLVAAPLPSQAQTTPQGPTPAEAQAALNPAPSQFTHAQLDQMLAPIALYPDQLLTQVLMASTFPQQLVDAQNWVQDSHNASLKGDDLANALTPLPWDPSVKSLVAFPQIIAMMVNHLDWTQALGTAFAEQEVQVFARVQF